MIRIGLAMDASTRRWKDENGFLHVDASHVTKEQVAPYYGREIPGWQERGIDPERIYYAYRPADELKRAASTINGLPIEWEHHPEDADDPQLEHRIGSMGTDGAWNPPYLDNSLIFTVGTAIEAIEKNQCRELSLSYRYDPDFTPGTFEGQPYDFVMRNIRANHLALVPEGRAGGDVLVADRNINQRTNDMAKRFRGAHDGDPDVEKQEVEASQGIKDMAEILLSLHRVDPRTGEVVDITEDEDKAAEIRKLVGELEGKLDPEEIKKLTDALTDLAYSKPTGDADDPSEEKAFAEGVKYAERLEGDPAERRRLDREHESEGMRAAMDKVGCDADDPAQQRAFAEGVKYGERLERDPAERRKLDREHEREGEEKALSKDEIVEAASDASLRRMQSLMDAQNAVRPHVGEIHVNLARDDANTVYGAALDALGVSRTGHPRSAWRSMFELAAQRKTGTDGGMASDAALPGNLAGLSRITNL